MIVWDVDQNSEGENLLHFPYSVVSCFLLWTTTDVATFLQFAEDPMAPVCESMVLCPGLIFPIDRSITVVLTWDILHNFFFQHTWYLCSAPMMIHKFLPRWNLTTWWFLFRNEGWWLSSVALSRHEIRLSRLHSFASVKKGQDPSVGFKLLIVTRIFKGLAA